MSSGRAEQRKAAAKKKSDARDKNEVAVGLRGVAKTGFDAAKEAAAMAFAKDHIHSVVDQSQMMEYQITSSNTLQRLKLLHHQQQIDPI